MKLCPNSTFDILVGNLCQFWNTFFQGPPLCGAVTFDWRDEIQNDQKYYRALMFFLEPISDRRGGKKFPENVPRKSFQKKSTIFVGLTLFRAPQGRKMMVFVRFSTIRFILRAFEPQKSSPTKCSHKIFAPQNAPTKIPPQKATTKSQTFLWD